MAGTAGERLHGLVNEQTVDAVLGAIDQALEQALIAATECEQRGQLSQVSSPVSGMHHQAGRTLCPDRSRPPVPVTGPGRGMAGGDRPRPGRRRVDTSAGDAPLGPWITRSGC
jgi:hypothetical protein